MILRKNISLTEEYLKKLGPLLEKHNGNLSAVIREVIDLADAVFADPDSVKRLISGLREEQNLTSSTLIWALKNLTGRMPDWEMVINIIGNNIFSVSSLETRLNELCGEIYWGSSIKISPDDDNRPTSAVLTITGKNQDMSRYLASVAALFTAKKFGLGVSGLKSINNSFEIEMKKGENEWILKSIIENFGYLDEVFSEIYKKPEFWSVLITLYIKMNYVGKWDTETFVNYMEEASVILGQDSNWSNVSENVIHGEITGCNLVKCNSDISITNCMFIKGIFNGWVNHAFGAPSKLVYNNGAGRTGTCEIYIAL